MMTLSEAIEHAEWCADNSCGECAEEHRQLAAWLRELADEQRKVLLLMTEVNTIRAECVRYETLIGILDREWGIDASWDGLRRVWYVGLNKTGMRERDEREAENAKLRELVRIAIEYCVNGYCAEEDECPLYESRHSCKLYAKARELGIEVPHERLR